MYSRLLPVLAFTLFEVFTVSYGLPRSSTSAILQRNSNLLSRQSFSCSCSSSATACSACGGTCCTAGDVCFTDPTGQQHTFSQEACCTGASCAGASPSSSSSASQPASTSTPSTSSPTPTSTPPPSSASVQNPEPSSTTAPASTTAAPPPPVKTTKTGAIVGGAVGGAAAVGGLAGILAFFTTQQGWYVLGSLAAALFGLFLFKSRRLVFSVDDDIGPTQISLFLTSHPKLIDTASADPQKLLVWKVFDIGHTQRQFDVTVPCVYKQGSPKIGFGTIDDDESRVKCVNFSPGPAYLDSEGVWHIDEDKPVDAHRPAFARNDSEKASRIAVGTLDDSGDTMEPFLLIEDTEFGNGSEYNAASDLYLHVFRSVGYSAGKYKDTIVKDIEGDRLTPVDGIKVKSLRPLTSWRIRSAGEGRLKLEIMANRKDDVKKYRHDCTIKKAAKHNGD